MNYMKIVDKFYNKSPRIRELIMKFVYGDEDIAIKLFDLEMGINTVRENGYLRASRMLSKGSLLRDEVPIFLSLSMILNKGDSFVDVGANIGIFSSIIARYQSFLSLKGVYAFEANPNTFERLKQNAKRHGFTAHNIGISNQECKLEFVDGAVSHVFTTINNASNYNINTRLMTVQCKRLEQFDIQGDSIVMKIDVEGQELKVLEGTRSFFDEQRIKAVYLDGFAQQEECLQFLQQYGFRLFDGRTLTKSDGSVFSLLALSEKQFRE